MKGDAVFSECRTYRYQLTREWDRRRRAILSPSRQMGTRAFFICAVVLISPASALSRVSDKLSSVCLDNNGQHEGGRFVMKNGRAIKGHRRIIQPIGGKPFRRKPPVDGYEVSCVCGWRGGGVRYSGSGTADLPSAH